MKLQVRILSLLIPLTSVTKYSSSYIPTYSFRYYWLNYIIKQSSPHTLAYVYSLPGRNPLVLNNILTTRYRIFFSKKEPFYTKLKYSRVPQFDTSSGAAASFISAFYGFLVCERFGFELLDSGDFLFLVVYVVLTSFTLPALLVVINQLWHLPRSLFY